MYTNSDKIQVDRDLYFYFSHWQIVARMPSINSEAQIDRMDTMFQEKMISCRWAASQIKNNGNEKFLIQRQNMATY